MDIRKTARIINGEVRPQSTCALVVDIGDNKRTELVVEIIETRSKKTGSPSSFKGFLQIPGTEARYPVQGSLHEGQNIYKIGASYECWTAFNAAIESKPMAGSVTG